MKKTSFTLILICVCLFTGMRVMAQSVTPSQADQVCQRFLMDKQKMKAGDTPTFQLAEVMLNQSGEGYVYRYNLNDEGFVLVSASTTTPPVLAYSFEGPFEMIPPVRDLLWLYEQEIAFAESQQLKALPKAAANWDRYLAAEYAPPAEKGTKVDPLLTSFWNQNKYYNTYCPWDVNAGAYYDYRVPNGCVALASSQIIYYHRWPEHGTGMISYIPSGYGIQTVHYNNEHYNYEAMCNMPTTYVNQISRLAYHFGVAIRMNYNYDGSGAQTDDAKERLRQTFLYDPSITTYYRGNYIDTLVEEYIIALKDQLTRRLPVYYSGCTQQLNSCHAYVVDGYDEDDLFHINYGWGGASNGNYAIDNFVAGYSHYDYSAEALFNIYPSKAYPAPQCQGHKRVTASLGTITDGSHTAMPYKANPDCSWMIAAPGAFAYNIQFDRMDLNPGVDYVTIYNGPTTASGIAGTFTGQELPTTPIGVNADSVLVTFTSSSTVDTNTQYYGFMFSYTSTLPTRSCNNVTNLTDWTTTISDGTDEGTNYTPQTSCQFNINHQYVGGYAFNFEKFDLGVGDFVDIYNNGTNPATFYKRFDLNNMPNGDYSVPFQKMRVQFVSDNYDQRDGFRFRYFTLTGIEENSGIEDLSVYPNPATDYLFVKFNVAEPTLITCKLMDATGKVLSMENMDAFSGENTHSIQTSSLATGFYLLEIDTPTGKTIRKVMVQ
ncbi:MAG: C10 family peptidase [Bacteroidales bacterium]|nr:C10 family peptidase [Bacteroidales bacterium]